MSISLRIENAVAYVTIEREERRNALDEESTKQLEDIWRSIENEKKDLVRAIVLTGAGDKAFCAGADLKSDTGKSGLEYWATAKPNGFGGLALRTSLDVPVIARVNGFALGGGFEMALGCDIIVAADTASFGLSEPRIGLLPLDGGMVLLQRLIPRKFALEILLTGNRFSASDGMQFGFVNEVVPAAELDLAVDRWLESILACAPLSLRAIKQVLNQTEGMIAQDAHSYRLPAVMEALTSNDAKEGIAAFQEKRNPKWTGT